LTLTAEIASPESKKKSVYVLGLSEAHNCTAALLCDGAVVAMASEERFSRRKNDTGFPRRAVDYVLAEAGIDSPRLDSVALSYINPYPHFGVSVDYVDEGHQESGARRVTPLRERVHAAAQLVYGMGARGGVAARVLDYLERAVYGRLYAPVVWPRLRKRQLAQISTELGVPESKISPIDHHLSHAASARWFASVPDGSTMVLTLDGAGDHVCSAVWMDEQGELTQHASSPNAYSLGILYSLVTHQLGMKAGEHEYKVMGLAPYADQDGQARVLPLLQEFIQLNGLEFTGPISTRASAARVEQTLRGKRFDWVSGAMQQLCEDLMREWATNAQEVTGAHNIVCAGGVFMNVKANMLIKDLPGIGHFGVCPSAGDESTAMGAAYEAYRRLTGRAPLPLDSIYTGPSFTDEEIETAIAASGVAATCDVDKPSDVDMATAQLLADGEIVARFQGRMEFGARALGNRSILAHPSDRDGIPILNEQIKQRDFWMPFAATVLDEAQGRYLINATNIPSPHMMVGFETTELGRRELRAAIHPVDKTVRPQILRHVDNPRYHRVISRFEELTGIGAVLNTSFNLHGEPVVCSPSDAIATLVRSGLRRLAIGPFVISKR